ncbi:hypothetical protein F52700_7311 [Fusarium sp. NRRL 52700]|nr:hypothetical protein F52700_7311 [Fusarium sp. NRRL 52700]
MSSATFHPFSRLPTELQLQIWKEACALPVIPGRDSFEQRGVHYVNVDTVKVDGRDRLALRVLDKKEGSSGNESIPNNNRSAYMWDGGLWWACKLSRESITEETKSNRLRLSDYSQSDFERAATLTNWKSLPQRFQDCNTALPSFDPLSSSTVPNCSLAIEFDSNWTVDLPETLEELKAENSARGLVATWMESVACGWVKVPELYLIDKDTLFVAKERSNCVYHNCDGEYVHMHYDWWSEAVDAFLNALADFLPFEEYGHIYEKTYPDCWIEDLNMWDDFSIFERIEVLTRFEHADHGEVSWTAVCNDLSDDHQRGSEKAISAHGRVYDLQYDDDVGYCVGYLANSNFWSFSLDDESRSDDKIDRVEYVKCL